MRQEAPAVAVLPSPLPSALPSPSLGGPVPSDRLMAPIGVEPTTRGALAHPRDVVSASGSSPDDRVSQTDGPSGIGGTAQIDDPSPGDSNDRGMTSPERMSTCTTAQLRRFIKSRAYIPMHEIRRRFLITTEDDDVAGVKLQSGRIYVGLPGREGAMLGELIRSGEVGYELQRDPPAPVVVGVYPMRPVTRP